MIFRILIQSSLIFILFLAGCSTLTGKSDLPACTQTDCACSDFATQNEAQEVLEAFPNDPYKLDRNGDGIACETLPIKRQNPAEHGNVNTANSQIRYGNPSNANAQDLNNYLLEKPGYVLSYNCKTGIANWASWQLNRSWLGNVDRSDDFRSDHDLPDNCYVARPSDYTRSGYDKGHLAPSGDRTKRKSDNSETFLMSNMIPQSPANNREVWRELEEYSRYLVSKGKELYIVSGGEGTEKLLLATHKSEKKTNKITVPKYTWKAILVLDKLGRIEDTIAVMIPNSEKVAQTDWTDYLISIDELEKKTGYNFFNRLKPEIQKEVESQVYKKS